MASQNKTPTVDKLLSNFIWDIVEVVWKCDLIRDDDSYGQTFEKNEK